MISEDVSVPRNKSATCCELITLSQLCSHRETKVCCFAQPLRGSLKRVNGFWKNSFHFPKYIHNMPCRRSKPMKFTIIPSYDINFMVFTRHLGGSIFSPVLPL
jgi:hypothetical protein